MSSGPAADCVRVVSAALMTYSITVCRTTSGGRARNHHHVGYQAIRAMRPRICRKRVPVKWLPASWLSASWSNYENRGSNPRPPPLNHPRLSRIAPAHTPGRSRNLYPARYIAVRCIARTLV